VATALKRPLPLIYANYGGLNFRWRGVAVFWLLVILELLPFQYTFIEIKGCGWLVRAYPPIQLAAR
jgi:hypothetical protein